MTSEHWTKDDELEFQMGDMHGEVGRPPQHMEFAKIRRQITANRGNGIQPTGEQVVRLRELDNWLGENTTYWQRHYAKL